MTKVFEKDGNRIVVADDATTDQFPGYTEEAPIVDLEALAAEVRAQRDELLAASDIDIIRAYESGVAVSEEIKTYRQALRDIPQNEGFPQTVVWPTKPGGTE